MIKTNTPFWANTGLISTLVAVASLTALGAALVAQYVFDLEPCILCIYQRVPYAITAVLGIGGAVLARCGKIKPAALFLFLSSVVFLVGAGIAFYHVGVEQHWWASALEGCAIDFSASADLLAQIEATIAVRCDQIAWVDPVLGQSMAVWNVVASLVLAVTTLTGSIFAIRKANGF